MWRDRSFVRATFASFLLTMWVTKKVELKLCRRTFLHGDQSTLYPDDITAHAFEYASLSGRSILHVTTGTPWVTAIIISRVYFRQICHNLLDRP
jgi:hypothetical protein